MNIYEIFQHKSLGILRNTYHLADGNVPFIKPKSISKVPLGFCNKLAIYFDEATLPPSCNTIVDLNGKNVLYGIFIEEANKIYVGKTTDLGERIATHRKDGLSKIKEIYHDMREYHNCFVFIIGVLTDEESLNNAEHDIIKCMWDISVEYACEQECDIIKNPYYISFIKEYKEEYNNRKNMYCYNINA